jgi:hypothetical protein
MIQLKLDAMELVLQKEQSERAREKERVRIAERNQRERNEGEDRRGDAAEGD